MKNNIINKDNINNKIRNNSSDNKRNEIYKNNLTEFNYNFRTTQINNLNKNMSFYCSNNKQINNFDANIKYNTNTEYKRIKSNQIVGNILMNKKNLFKSNENEEEKIQNSFNAPSKK